MNSRVALVACPSYEPEMLEGALRRGLSLLGGIDSFISWGERILIKPNLLSAAPPSRAVCTHPMVFEVLCRILSDAGASIRYGDSPGFGTPQATIKATGYWGVADRFGAVMADFTSQIKIDHPRGSLLKSMVLCPAVQECDAIISVSKLKTHGLTRMTGAVKNCFGCVPGLLKGEYHLRMPDIRHFSRALLDICSRVSPRLHIMDAVVAMSGNGPRSGDPCPLGALLLSRDAVALDRAACRLIHLPAHTVPTITSALSVENCVEDDLDLAGDDMSTLSRPDFDIPRTSVDVLASRRHFPQFLKRHVSPKPLIDPRLCSRCGICERICPVSPKAMIRPDAHHPPRADMDHCIRCYCCQELCPSGAIRLETPWLGRLIHHMQSEQEAKG